MRSILVIFILFSGMVFADKGQILYESHCIECHSRMTGGDGNVLYKRDDKIVSSKITLTERVNFCAESVSAQWSQSDVDAVTNYLNEKYYKF